MQIQKNCCGKVNGKAERTATAGNWRARDPGNRGSEVAAER